VRALAICFALALAGGNARADNYGEILFQTGRKAYREKRYRVAADAFEAAYRLDHLPGLLFNEATALRRLYENEPNDELLMVTIRAYRRYLDAFPDGPQVKEARHALDELSRLLPPEPQKSPPVDAAASTTAPSTTVPPATVPPTPVPLTTAPVNPSPPATATVFTVPPRAVTDPDPRWSPSALSPTLSSTQVTTEPQPQSQPAEAPRRRRWVLPVVVFSVLATAAIAIGVGVGVATSSSSSKGGPGPPSLGVVTYP
jgi:hypothetical protein